MQILLALNINNSVLPGGLLHSIPTDILKTYSNIQYLIQECVTPRILTRVTAGIQLKKLLDTIVKDKNEYSNELN